MKDLIIKIENKLQTQVDHVLNVHNSDMLKIKVYDLAFEWYMKGLQSGIEHERECNNKKNK
jgi:hypothetical protein